MDVPGKKRGNQRLKRPRPLWEVREVGTADRFFLSFKKRPPWSFRFSQEILEKCLAWKLLYLAAKTTRRRFMGKLATFDDWTDLFRKWQKDIGFDGSLVKDFKFDALYDGGTHPEIEFGEFAGGRKWDNILQVPTQDMRDALLHLIVYQGDTEFASSEQQRNLLDTAPSAHDHQCLLRVMREEMRHGCQMSHILVNHFGYDGKLEARKL
jgi:hypothetical protein